jgi:hypothetical protein
MYIKMYTYVYITFDRQGCFPCVRVHYPQRLAWKIDEIAHSIVYDKSTVSQVLLTTTALGVFIVCVVHCIVTLRCHKHALSGAAAGK